MLLSRSQSAALSIEYLSTAMDEFHNRFPVYDDVSSAGNHFHGRAKIPAGANVSMNGSWTVNPHSGATAIRSVFTSTGNNFGGFYYMNGVLPDGESAVQLNFGDVPNAGIDLTGATKLTFWARGEVGGERIEFFTGGVGRNAFTGVPTNPFPDSSARIPSVGNVTTLTADWRQYEIVLPPTRDLSYVLGGFGWTASAANNPTGAVFYLDDLEFELDAATRTSRLNEPRFIRSYGTLPLQPDLDDGNPDDDIDFVLRNLAFTYDNSLAALAFLADRDPSTRPDSLRRARLIGDALVYAYDNDRSFTGDGHPIRTAYQAGDIALPPGWTPNGRSATAPIPGFFVESTQRFVEVEQEAVDVGNNAWAMIALLALHRRTGNADYLRVAGEIGTFIRGLRNDDPGDTFHGFQGGFDLDTPEWPLQADMRRPWASVEHNLDVGAAFRTMAELTGDTTWRDDSQHAFAFVEDMWDETRGAYLAGTLNPNARNENPGQLPLDAQAWSVLASMDVLGLHPNILTAALQNHGTTDGMTDGLVLQGVDFNDDLDGVWPEGTAQMALSLQRAGMSASAGAFLDVLEAIQSDESFGPGPGIPAASRDGLTTGFGFKYFVRDHIATAAWNVFAQLNFNPFDQTEIVAHTLGTQRARVRVNGEETHLIDDATDQVLEIATRAGLISASLNGTAGDDTLMIDFSGGNPVPPNGLTFDGAGQDTTAGDGIELIGGSADAISHQFDSASSGSISINQAGLITPVFYNGLEPIADNLSAIDRVFSFGATPDDILVEDVGTPEDGLLRISSAGSSETVIFRAPSNDIIVNAGDGDDRVIATGIPGSLELNGQGGGDTLHGGSGFDQLNGGDGPDIAIGFDGNDTITGGEGNDTLLGGAGRDRLNGQGGDDYIRGNGGSGDLLTGGPGNDVLRGDAGRDRLVEIADVDFVLADDRLAGTGNNTLTGIETATLLGGPGDNRIDASAFSGNVILLGLNGNDTVTGGAGDDQLRGGAGRDVLRGGPGHDNIKGQGGSGDDLSGGAGNDTLDGGPGNDRLRESADVNFRLNDGRLEGLGTDQLVSLEVAVIFGGPSANRIDAFGWSGSALLFGLGGDDTLIGGFGNDRLQGGSGRDVLRGNGGNDLLLGQGGNADDLRGDTGTDTLHGGTGADRIRHDDMDVVIPDPADVLIPV